MMCKSCAQSAHLMAIGHCSSCGAMTSSMSYKYCTPCSNDKKECQGCGKTLDANGAESEDKTE